MVTEVGQQVLAGRVDEHAQPAEQQRPLHAGAEPRHQALQVAEIDEGMAEVVVVRQRGRGERRLERVEVAAPVERIEQERRRPGFVLRLDRTEESGPAPARRRLQRRERKRRLAQGVVGDVRQRLGGAGQALGRVAASVAQAQPDLGAGPGVGHAVAQPLVAARDRLRERDLGGGAGALEAGQLAGDARRVVVGHRRVELEQRLADPLFGRRLARIDPDDARLHPDRIDAQAVAAIVVAAGPEIELPVVPVAGEHAAGVEVALDQRIALVRAAVVAGVDRAVVEEERELLRAELDGRPTGAAQALELDRPGPARLALKIRRGLHGA